MPSALLIFSCSHEVPAQPETGDPWWVSPTDILQGKKAGELYSDFRSIESAGHPGVDFISSRLE
jgi:hypothetical protein